MSRSSGYPAGRADLAARLGSEAGAVLQSGTVGLGAIGAPVAFELARLGVGRLVLADGDRVDPAMCSRQLPGWSYAGVPKTAALGAHILGSTPHVEFAALLGSVGEGDPADLDVLLAADLVVDATPNRAFTRYVAAHARMTGTP